MTPQKTIALDEEGYFVLQDGVRLADPYEGISLLKKLRMTEEGGCWTDWNGESLLVEPFDKPLVAQQIIRNGNLFEILAPYSFTSQIVLESLCLDPWDRFHGLTVQKIPFVMTRKAQAEFFNLVDNYDDDSLTIAGRQYPTPPFYIENNEIQSTPFWNTKYQQASPRWDLNQHHPAFEAILPQIKINKCRVLNLGCGRGHDAAYFAKQGHIVRGVDFSSTAIAQARDLYGSLNNLQFEEADALRPNGFTPADLILEHTLFCAISPQRRKDLILQWKRCLDDRGHLLGLFFVHPYRGGPPYGGSEWELREYLEKHFRLLYWKRWPLSPPQRQGTELVIYAQKK
jgi:SAM-dependent methyltransferase